MTSMAAEMQDLCRWLFQWVAPEQNTAMLLLHVQSHASGESPYIPGFWDTRARAFLAQNERAM